jgi:hypothetical protein
VVDLKIRRVDFIKGFIKWFAEASDDICGAPIDGSVVNFNAFYTEACARWAYVFCINHHFL